MNYRPCGDLDLRLPVLGLGCWPFGGGEYWGPAAQADIDAVVRFAVDQGCNYFDTAEAYSQGASEAALGRALRGIPRDRVLVGTKISPSNTAPEVLAVHCEASLRRLQDRLPRPVHGPLADHAALDRSLPPPADAHALGRGGFCRAGRLRQSGKIRYVGVSNFGREKLDEALATGTPIAVNELPYSLLTRGIENGILPHCRRRGVGVIGYMPLMQGVLAGIYPTLDNVPVWRRRTRHFDCRRTPQCRHGRRRRRTGNDASPGGDRPDRPPSRAGHGQDFAAVGDGRPGIACSLCGTTSIVKLKQNLACVRLPLPPQIVEELGAATRPLMDALGPGFDYYEAPENDRTR